MRGLPGTSRTPARADRAGAWRVAAVAALDQMRADLAPAGADR